MCVCMCRIVCEKLYVYARVCQVRTGLWWSANILCDVCDVCADRPKGIAPHRCADVSLFLLFAFTGVIL